MGCPMGRTRHPGCSRRGRLLSTPAAGHPGLMALLVGLVCVAAALPLMDAIFLAPCLWRFQRSRSAPPESLSSWRPSPLTGARFLVTDADACSLLCKAPLAPSATCQRCCRGAATPGVSGALWGSPGLSPWGSGLSGLTSPLASLLAALGWPKPPTQVVAGAGIAATPGASLPLVPINQLPGVINQVLGVKPSGWGATGSATGTGSAGGSFAGGASFAVGANEKETGTASGSATGGSPASGPAPGSPSSPTATGVSSGNSTSTTTVPTTTTRPTSTTPAAAG
ncbi:uncharacterized transmembrane protein DDB_G0289901-like [Frankliniella occidentalis]|uniref:Uncharacterized transmembrane protein DDB_G0289901-like n=1 Tax=Frankliniella occidentalis TaxID=133901 RepID=A0A6J1TJD5_FRAOC|nr:uncharacterized transmembrane protein DDB_G0289901-like [Frankliniella occidentalis]